MPIIGNVGRRSLRVRVLNLAIHLVLIAGAVTMVWPMLVMISGSVKGEMDSKDLTIVPKYFYDETMLYKRWVEAKYNEMPQEYNLCDREPINGFEEARPPDHPVEQRYRDWNAFRDEVSGRLNEFHLSSGDTYGIGNRIRPELTRKFVAELKAEPEVQGDIRRLNDKYKTSFDQWDYVTLSGWRGLERGRSAEWGPFMKRVMDFHLSQERRHHLIYSLDAFFVETYLKSNYTPDIRKLNEALGTSFRHWGEVTLSRRMPAGPMKTPWVDFVKKQLNSYFVSVTEAARPSYQTFLRGQYRSIDGLNAVYGTVYNSFEEIALPENRAKGGAPYRDWALFISEAADPAHVEIQSAEFMYRDFLQRKYGDIASLIAAQRQGVQSLDDLELTDRMPADNLARRDDWIKFIEREAVLDWLKPSPASTGTYREFLTAPYRSGERLDLDALNAALGTRYNDANDIFVPATAPDNPKLAERWRAFVLGACPSKYLMLDVQQAAPAWRKFIRSEYADAQTLNRRYGYVPSEFESVQIPTRDIDCFDFQKTKRHSFREFLTRNYAIVFDTMMYSGRAIPNTLIYCALAVLGMLLVNPLAAYALSRYKPPSQYKLLLFMMLTMAFPPMVLSIPNYLLLRDLHLLNTFAALVLPTLANGYMIFLLKGFFDSLPRELYESAQIDGASEWTMFWQIAMANSKPILAVMALQAFTLAYGNFIFAFIVCQDPKMWTMMVHVYQLQQRSSQAVSFAALCVTAIPTLLLFIFCQRMILRGIVVPTEK